MNVDSSALVQQMVGEFVIELLAGAFDLCGWTTWGAVPLLSRLAQEGWCRKMCSQWRIESACVHRKMVWSRSTRLQCAGFGSKLKLSQLRLAAAIEQSRGRRAQAHLVAGKGGQEVEVAEEVQPSASQRSS